MHWSILPDELIYLSGHPGLNCRKIQFDDLQLLEGVIENGEPIVTFDRTGFMGKDINNFLGAIDPEAWQNY